MEFLESQVIKKMRVQVVVLFMIGSLAISMSKNLPEEITGKRSSKPSICI